MITPHTQDAFRLEIETLRRPCSENEFAEITMKLEDVVDRMFDRLPDYFFDKNKAR